MSQYSQEARRMSAMTALRRLALPSPARMPDRTFGSREEAINWVASKQPEGVTLLRFSNISQAHDVDATLRDVVEILLDMGYLEVQGVAPNSMVADDRGSAAAKSYRKDTDSTAKAILLGIVKLRGAEALRTHTLTLTQQDPTKVKHLINDKNWASDVEEAAGSLVFMRMLNERQNAGSELMLRLPNTGVPSDKTSSYIPPLIKRYMECFWGLSDVGLEALFKSTMPELRRDWVLEKTETWPKV